MKEDIHKSHQVLKEGGIILYPTDTIWGLGCDATNADAVARIYRIKKREDTKSMLVLVDGEDKLYRYITRVPDMAIEISRIADKPTTIIYPGVVDLAENLIAEDQTMGFRITFDPFCQQLIRNFGKPVVSTSANISGENPPANFSKISDEIKSAVDYVVRWRQNETRKGEPSSIIKIGINNEIQIIRN
ncbi:MAG: threonylcarbamoyl-AMP synthase [Bacteroidales bacterium]|nr:threonylcarbamoyl-AMP synthase [Bacteroidales bacterium]